MAVDSSTTRSEGFVQTQSPSPSLSLSAVYQREYGTTVHFIKHKKYKRRGKSI